MTQCTADEHVIMETLSLDEFAMLVNRVQLTDLGDCYMGQCPVPGCTQMLSIDGPPRLERWRHDSSWGK